MKRCPFADTVLYDDLLAASCLVEPCGSRVTCNPAPTDTDEDYLVEMPSGREDSVSRIVSLLAEAGFRWEGTEHYQMAANEFMSWRRDDINLIVTANSDFARRHRAATHVCKRLNLMVKDDRIALFQAVLYGDIAKQECAQPPSFDELLV
ncbi:hypothetical protein NKI96_10555 [Mesorhizobium sp. M0292]|uniref:hypothetical protein n=1 Tax=Mesorhizobium sp. M0292 TaxID=2956929 RepID=UPI00333DC7DD